MIASLGEWLVSQAGLIEDPDAPAKKHSIAEPEELAQCIDALLARAGSRPQVADLPRRVEVAAMTLQNDTLVAATLLTAVKALGEGFENFLQVIALVKYEQRPDLLDGGEGHVGFMHSSIGSLLLGTPAPTRQASEEQKRSIPKASIVRFSYQSKELAPRLYNLVREARNQVHAARQPDTFELLRDARRIVAAYVLAADENRSHLSQLLAPHGTYLRHVIDRSRSQLPFVIEPVLGRAQGGKSQVSFEQLVQHVSTEPCTLVVTGDPGAGKTTLIRSVVGRLAEQRLSAPFRDLPLPVYVEASRYSTDRPFVEHVAGELGLDVAELEAQWGSRRLAICLDGANEIPARLLRDALLDIERLHTQFPVWSIVLTSRLQRLPSRFEFEGMRLLPFDDAQMLDYLRRAFADDTRAQDFSAQLDAVPRLRMLCRNPLLLHMLVDLSRETFRVPENRGQLLHQFMTRFLERERAAFLPIEPLTLQTVLAQLAFTMRERRVVALPERETHRIVAAAVAGLQSGVGTVDLVGAAVGAQLLHRVGADQVQFFHELVQEYFAALRVVDIFESDGTLPAGVGSDRWWEEIAVLAYGLSNESPGLLTALRRTSISLSARSVMDAPVPGEDGLRAVVHGARSELSHGVQPEALQALGIVWNQAAQASILSALPSASALTDFLLNFKEEPFAAAVDLLASARTPDAFKGIAAAMKRSRASDAERRRLGGVFAGLLSEWARAGQAPIEIFGLRRYCREARFAPADSATVRADLRRLFGQQRGFSATDAIVRQQTIMSEHTGTNEDDWWRQDAARLLLGGDLKALADHMSRSTESDREWLAPMLPAMREHFASSDGDFVTRIEGACSGAGAAAIQPRLDQGPDDESVPVAGGPSADAAPTPAVDVPSHEDWMAMDADDRRRFFNRESRRRGFIDIVCEWPDFLAEAFREHVHHRIKTARMDLAEEVCEYLGIPDRGLSLAEAHLRELTAAGDLERAAAYAMLWGFTLPSRMATPLTIDALLALEPQELATRVRTGLVTLEDGEQWLLAQVRRGAVDQVLPIAHHVRSVLGGAASIAIAECIEAGQDVPAGQMIVAFQLEDEFVHELPRLAAVLMSAGKPGLAGRFASHQRSSPAEVNRAAVQRLEEAISGGQISHSIQMVRAGGFGYLEDDLRKRLTEHVERLVGARDAAGLAEMLREPAVWSYVSHTSLLHAAGTLGLLLKARVRVITARGVAWLDLVRAGERVSFERRSEPRVYGRLRKGAPVYVAVQQRGVDLFAARVVEGDEQGPEVMMDQESEGAPADEPGSLPAGDGLDALSRRWGARLRR